METEDISKEIFATSSVVSDDLKGIMCTRFARRSTYVVMQSKPAGVMGEWTTKSIETEPQHRFGTCSDSGVSYGSEQLYLLSLHITQPLQYASTSLDLCVQ